MVPDQGASPLVKNIQLSSLHFNELKNMALLQDTVMIRFSEDLVLNLIL